MIYIREMTIEDLNEVIEIENKTFSHPWTIKDFTDSINNKNHIYLVAIEGVELMGYCGLWQVLDEGQINNVAVKKEARNKGIGALMLRELIERAKKSETKAFTLEVRVSNQSAIKLYTNQGFKSVGVRKDFYDTPKEDAMIMWLYI